MYEHSSVEPPTDVLSVKMGGHGGLNILPQKRWHVYRDDNRLRVLRDEREFQEAVEAERQQHQRRVMSDVITRLKRRKYEIADESPAAHTTATLGDAAAPLTTDPARAQQPKGDEEPRRAQSGTFSAGLARASRDDVRSLAQGTCNRVGQSNSNETRMSPARICGSAGVDHCNEGNPPAALPSKMLRSGGSRGRPVMAQPLSLNSRRPGPLGREREGHFNFFADAEREEAKRFKERERYLLQAGHTTSRQSEFSSVAQDLKNTWYQSEMPSNRIAREEREGFQPPATACASVEAAAQEAQRRMLVLKSQKSSGGKPPSSTRVIPTVEQQGAECLLVDSDNIDDDVCIVKECFVGSRAGGKGDTTAKRGSSKAKGDRKERKLLKRMKRKWMLEALELQANVQGLVRQDRGNGGASS